MEFSVIQANVGEHWNSHKEELERMLEEDKDINVVLLQEPSQTYGCEIDNFTTFFSKKRKDAEQTAVLISNSWMNNDGFTVTDITKENHDEKWKNYIKAINVENQQMNFDFTFVSVYCPGTSSFPIKQKKALIDELQQYKNSNSLISGDFNAHHPAWGSESKSQGSFPEYVNNSLDGDGFALLNDEFYGPTYNSGASSSNIDLSILSTKENQYCSTEWTIPPREDYFFGHKEIKISIRKAEENEELKKSEIWHDFNAHHPAWGSECKSQGSFPEYGSNSLDGDEFTPLNYERYGPRYNSEIWDDSQEVEYLRQIFDKLST